MLWTCNACNAFRSGIRWAALCAQAPDREVYARDKVIFSLSRCCCKSIQWKFGKVVRKLAFPKKDIQANFVFKYFYVHPCLWKILILTSIFQLGWNQKLVLLDSIFCCSSTAGVVRKGKMVNWRPITKWRTAMLRKSGRGIRVKSGCIFLYPPMPPHHEIRRFILNDYRPALSLISPGTL